jgi:transcriptional regulator with XRE-family HTH domain
MKPNVWDLSPKSAFEAAAGESIDSWFALHDALTDAREDLGLTQQQVAEILKVSQPAISAFENSNATATQIGTVINYAASLGLKINFSVKNVRWRKSD